MDDSISKLAALRAKKSKDYEGFVNEQTKVKDSLKRNYAESGKPIPLDELDRGYSGMNEEQAYGARDMQHNMLGELLMEKVPELKQGSSQQAFEKVFQSVYPGLDSVADELGVGRNIRSLPAKDYDNEHNGGGGLAASLMNGSSAGIQDQNGITLRETGNRAEEVGTMAHEIGHLHDQTAKAYQDKKFKNEMDQYSPDAVEGNHLSNLLSRLKQARVDKEVNNFIRNKPASAPYFKDAKLSNIETTGGEGMPAHLDGHNEEYYKSKAPMEMQRDMSKDHHLERNFSEDNLKKLLETGNVLDVVQTDDPRKEALKKIIG